MAMSDGQPIESSTVIDGHSYTSSSSRNKIEEDGRKGSKAEEDDEETETETAREPSLRETRACWFHPSPSISTPTHIRIFGASWLPARMATLRFQLLDHPAVDPDPFNSPNFYGGTARLKLQLTRSPLSCRSGFRKVGW